MFPWKPASLFTAGLLLVCSTVCSAEQAGTPVASDKAPILKDPLRKLRDRSPVQRWKSATRQWAPREDSRNVDPKRSAAESIQISVERPELSKDAVPPSEPRSLADKLAENARVIPESDALDPPMVSTVRIDLPEPAAEVPAVTPPPAPDRIARRSQETGSPVPPAPDTTAAEKKANRYTLRRIDQIDPHIDYRSGSTQTPADSMLPEEFELGATSDGPRRPYSGRSLPDTLVHWKASNLKHRPLYFEDVQMERYGYTHHPVVQPFVSVSRFGLQLIGLPYQAAIDPYHKDMYTLGYYRPGEWAPPRYYQIPLNIDAIATQTAATFGAFIIFP